VGGGVWGGGVGGGGVWGGGGCCFQGTPHEIEISAGRGRSREPRGTRNEGFFGTRLTGFRVSSAQECDCSGGISARKHRGRATKNKKTPCQGGGLKTRRGGEGE